MQCSKYCSISAVGIQVSQVIILFYVHSTFEISIALNFLILTQIAYYTFLFVTFPFQTKSICSDSGRK